MFIKDPASKIVINTDEGYYNALLAARAANKRTSQLQDQLDTLGTEFKEIKSLFLEVMNGKNTHG